MNKLIFSIACLSIFWACKEQDPLKFSQEKASLYFYVNSDYTTNYISKTFGATLDSQITVNIPVYCSGLASSKDRFFSFEIDTITSTAKAGIDFVIPDKLQLFPANSYTSVGKIVIKNTSILKDSTLVINLKLVKCNDFDLGEVKRLNATIRFTDGLTKPPNWDETYLKVYSKVKHKIFLIITKLDEYPTPDMYAKRKQYYQFLVPKEVSAYIKANAPVYDENGNEIKPW